MAANLAFGGKCGQSDHTGKLVEWRISNVAKGGKEPVVIERVWFEESCGC